MGVVLSASLQRGRLAVPAPEWIEKTPDWMDEDTRRHFADLYEIQRETGLTLPELTVRFLMADPDFTAVIPGACTMRELEENANTAAAGPPRPT